MLIRAVKEPWTYYTGAILLAVLNTLLFVVAGRPWQITSGFTYWAAWIWKAMGGTPEKWDYFANHPGRAEAIAQGFFTNNLSLMDAGIIVGALLAVLAASQFKFKRVKSFKQVAAALLEQRYDVK
ncbi:YeeE/YedE thiosulfate transporter family protein [Desulfitibacter alkalitolerans]|uniref:YeeE/YedE thiosulfate transporter family protein n=1 Tax=Desulfitibacter alkalitolerans TaxID=264641 RepID=UPI000685B25A|nr:YeeE/YedE thiosulfate transporter family protein [Desulfitibacter alkalitolerans]